MRCPPEIAAGEETGGISPLRRKMMEDLQLAGYSAGTCHEYVRNVRKRDFWKTHRNPVWLFPAPGRGGFRMGQAGGPMAFSGVQTAFQKALGKRLAERTYASSEKSLKHAVKEFIAHYNHERNHQGMENNILFPDERVRGTGKITKHERLGGLLNYYYREAG